jgi:hypothetical protein
MSKTSQDSKVLGQVRPTTFWGEIAPSEHIVQMYEDDGVVLDSLEGFVAEGIEAGDAVIVIATAPHRAALEDRLRMRGISLNVARSRDQYIALDAEETLTRFLVQEWPDQELFESLITGLIARARGNHVRKVRAFGEIVALLWNRGLNGATVRLEYLWQSLCQREQFSLFCAYPKSGFTVDAEDSMRTICEAHSRVLAS